MLNFFLKYLNSLENKSEISNETNDWTKNSDLENGFNWKSSSNGCTEGILMWNKPFVIKCLDDNQNEEEVSIFEASVFYS